MEGSPQQQLLPSSCVLNPEPGFQSPPGTSGPLPIGGALPCPGVYGGGPGSGGSGQRQLNRALPSSHGPLRPAGPLINSDVSDVSDDGQGCAIQMIRDALQEPSSPLQ